MPTPARAEQDLQATPQPNRRVCRMFWSCTCVRRAHSLQTAMKACLMRRDLVFRRITFAQAAMAIPRVITPSSGTQQRELPCNEPDEERSRDTTATTP